MDRRTVLKNIALLSFAVTTCRVSPAFASPTVDQLSDINAKIIAIEARATDLRIPQIEGLPNIVSNVALSPDTWYREAAARLLGLMQRALEANQPDVISEAADLLVQITDIERSPSEYFLASRAKAPAFLSIKRSYGDLFDKCKIAPEYKATIGWYTNLIKRNKQRYDEVSEQTQIPWHFIAVIHGLESSFNFQTHLHNGDRLTTRTTHVPAGRPKSGQPPFTWKDSAVDALVLMKYVDRKDWTLERTLYRLEGYNGWGYRSKKININTPYLWSFSNHYSTGKYVKDGKYVSSTVSQQCGAAVLLKALTLSGDVSW
ncbi:MAG: hypothetical protein EOR00_31485 [Mesorhizobium sp.]|uniref:hypothetical protein n=1 Tax=Mesorhizobium sp. TaxID=1871066 RepID=UPI000FE8D98F|nr:hypothetical protein [Mesorhizobium sp.]RWP10017.1 MAG: hypothetical protein EOR00_31485 [Mesorhizobium sp.]